uniref:Alternative protein EXOSC10 n=1 Tax=Homo sapiens TaxID=9606 RepID=L8E6Y6_HUMAN|nr:alternative protein EXOSC10 [Homo sapiens]
MFSLDLTTAPMPLRMAIQSSQPVDLCQFRSRRASSLMKKKITCWVPHA